MKECWKQEYQRIADNSFPKAKRPFPIVVHLEFIQINLLHGSRTAQSHYHSSVIYYLNNF